MPLSYTFVDADGRPVLLEEIDAMICADFGKECSDAVFSIEFTIISNIGDRAYASGEWDQAVFDDATRPCDGAGRYREIGQKYLHGAYRYSCWHSCSSSRR